MAEPKTSGLLPILATSAIAGSLLHQLFFKQVEVDKRPVSTAAASAGSYFLVVSLLKLLLGQNHGEIWPYLVGFLAWITAFSSLWLNILVYRALFHPLNHFPGPFGAKLTKFWTLRKVLESKLRWYQVVDKLHAQYGDYVRTGPRELLIFDPAAIVPILGFASITNKGPFYDSLEKSVNTSRDKDFHKKRRKIWDVAFKTSLADYGPRIEDFTSQLLVRIGKNAGNPVGVNELCIHYSYDVMSALAFGKAMGFITGTSEGDATEILQNMQEGVDAIGFLLHIPWLLGIVTTFSWAIGPLRKWNNYSNEQAELRKKMKNPKPDLFGHLYKSTEDTPEGRTVLFSEARLIIGAGSDTTATALTNIFVILSVYPEWATKLRAEVDASFKDGTYACTRPLPIMDGIINETLRLHPSVYFPSQRETPPQGMTIGDTFIPGGAIISIPPYQVHRDQRNFVRPNEFLPERWSSQPELVLNRNAFMPFMIGPYNCAGKSLAMMELRSVISRTIHEFDVGFPPNSNFNPDDYFSRSKDHFVAGAALQDLVFTQRKGR
ncbi:hypothetical protein FQN52_002216 [Onygenales sp. PD_12]|nr:hypothetical protein FQN52_002216 [Onygenales sp. PD_12]